ncbi:DNA sulfur modification protein DndB [Sphingopyxis sp. 550A]
MQINLPDPPLGTGVPVFGNVVSENEFQGVLPHGLFKMLVPDPRKLEGNLVKYNADLSAVATLRSRVQRLVNGAKRRNVEPYAKYIINSVKTGEGFTPQIVLWSEKPIQVASDDGSGVAWALVPHEMRFVALDGDTQTTARNLADGMVPTLFDRQKIKIVIVHGIPEDQAQQIFADCNSQGVKVSTSMAIGLDNRDDATQLAKQIEKLVPPLSGRVNRQKRQLGSKDEDLITISALRAAVVCFVEGIGGVQYQTKNVEIPIEDQDRYRDAASMWFSAAVNAWGEALSPEHRASTFAAAPAVWCAVGALGHDAYQDALDRMGDSPLQGPELNATLASAAQQKIGSMDWQRNESWLALGAKQSSSGAITLGGPKETASLIYKALRGDSEAPPEETQDEDLINGL